MIQQITPMLSTLSLTRVFRKNKQLVTWCLSVVAMLSLVGLYAAPENLQHRLQQAAFHPFSPAGDTSITETICANGFYVFNGDTITEAGQYSAVLVGADGLDSIVSLDVFVLPVSSSSLTASICDGSTYEFNGEVLTQSGTYEAVLLGANGCDSTVTLTLTVLPTALTKIDAGICTGSTYIFQGDTLTESGYYTVVLTAANGCDSIVGLTLQVVPFFNHVTNAGICAGGSYVFQGDTLKVAGTYADTLQAAGGCDSILTLVLKVLPVPVTNLEVGICTGFEYVFHGDTLDASGIYTDTLAAANGCDSLVVLDLTVADFFDTQLNLTLCAGETYVFGDTTLGIEGIYVDSLSAAGGCDSTVTLTLTVLPVLTGTDQATICNGDTLDYNGELLTEADVYEFVLTGVNGCDSTVTFTLNVLPTSASSLDASICQGASYDFNGDTLDQSGTYVQVFPALNGCDSTVTLNLTVLPVAATDILTTLCAGDSLVYNGDTLTVSGNYPYVFTGLNGCDSTVTIVLTVLPELTTAVDASICANETYVFNGDTLDQAGIYTAVLTNGNGCDSTVVLTLDVKPVQSSSVMATICAGTNYVFNGDTLTTANVYTAVLESANGCDSTVTLTLTVLPIHDSTFAAVTCSNEPYAYNGQVFTASGAYPFVLQGSNGCDSTLTLLLTVLPVSETTIAASICAGEEYATNGDTLTEAGDYTYTLTAANGCDSVVTVVLTVRPLLSSSTTLTLCDNQSYIFGNDTLTSSGTYVQVQPGSNGCDSTATLNLTFVPFFASVLEATVCNGETYAFGGELLNLEGVYTDSLTATGGCDSIVTLTLTVLPVSASTTDVTICSGDSFDFNGETYSASGTYTSVQTGANGCDSIATLQLTVLNVSITTLTATICANETYEFAGTVLTASGNYTASLTSSAGCDSLLVLTLTVLPAPSETLSITVCNGGTYISQGDTLTASGIYISSFVAANGCDSTLTLTLTIIPVIPPTVINAAICAGASYVFQGTPLTAAGTYTDSLSTAAGCDSLVTLNLTVNPVVMTELEATICAGESYPFNGQLVSAAGIYTVLLQSSAGCDSILTLTLIVNTVNTTVTLQNGTLSAQATNATYQWIDCANNTPIAGATGSSYTPTVTGNYAAFITENGCSGISACQMVTVVGAYEPLAESSWSVQPNPARTEASVVLNSTFSSNTWIELYDASGRLLQKQTVAAGANQVDLDLTGLADGLLLVRLVNEQSASTKRLIKNGN